MCDTLWLQCSGGGGIPLVAGSLPQNWEESLGMRLGGGGGGGGGGGLDWTGLDWTGI